MIYEFKPFHEIASKYIPNTPRWHEEILEKTDDYELNVDWDYYLQASVMGHCFAAIMTDGEEILGSAVYSVLHNPRHKHILMASSDAVFVEEVHRGTEAVALLKFAHNTLHTMGVKEINYTWSDQRLGDLLDKLGFTPTHTVWSKKLEEYHGQ